MERCWQAAVARLSAGPAAPEPDACCQVRLRAQEYAEERRAAVRRVPPGRVPLPEPVARPLAAERLAARRVPGAWPEVEGLEEPGVPAGQALVQARPVLADALLPEDHLAAAGGRWVCRHREREPVPVAVRPPQPGAFRLKQPERRHSIPVAIPVAIPVVPFPERRAFDW
jgi:hypothetical protein